MSLDTSDRRSGAYRSVTRLVIALMATLFVIGCGSSRGEYVHPGPGPGPGVDTGILIFHFDTLGQTALDVPYAASDISRVKFELFDANHDEIANSPRNVTPFTNPITLTNVPVSVEHVDITFYNQFNFPIFAAEVDVDVFANEASVVDFAGVNGEVPTFEALTVTPDTLLINSGDTGQLAVTAAFGNGDTVTVPTSDLAAAGVTFTSNAPTVASVDADGLVTGEAFGTADITASLTTNGDTRTDIVEVTVDADVGVLAYIEVEPATATLPISNANIDFEYPLTVTGYDAFDDEVIIDLADFTVSSDDTDVATVAVVGNEVIVTTTETEGEATITVTNDADNTITASSELTTVEATVDSIELLDSADEEVEDLDLYVSQSADLTVTATFSNADDTLTFDVPNFQTTGLLSNTGNVYLGYVDGEFIALQETPSTETVTLSVNTDITTGGAAVTEDIDVDIRRVQLTEVAVRIGGIELDLEGTPPTAIIPASYTGVLEVFGTFEDESSRILSGYSNDYTISSVDDGFTSVAANGFQTNEAITAPVSTTATTTFTITFNPDRNGDLDPIEINLASAGNGYNASTASVTFANYSDDLRLIGNGPAREVDLRIDFDNVPNFRIAYEDVFQIASPATNVNKVESFGHWPMLEATGPLGGPTDVAIQVGPAGNVNAFTATLTGVTSVVPTFLGIEPDEVTPYILPGQWASFSTYVVYNDGEDPVNRSADYPVFERFYDFISEVYVTLDTDAGVSNFFLKRTPNNPPLSVRIVDLTGAPQDSIGDGDSSVQFTGP